MILEKLNAKPYSKEHTLLIIDEDTYNIKSEIGGVYFIAREDGLVIFDAKVIV